MQPSEDNALSSSVPLPRYVQEDEETTLFLEVGQCDYRGYLAADTRRKFNGFSFLRCDGDGEMGLPTPHLSLQAEGLHAHGYAAAFRQDPDGVALDPHEFTEDDLNDAVEYGQYLELPEIAEVSFHVECLAPAAPMRIYVSIWVYTRYARYRLFDPAPEYFAQYLPTLKLAKLNEAGLVCILSGHDLSDLQRWLSERSLESELRIAVIVAPANSSTDVCEPYLSLADLDFHRQSFYRFLTSVDTAPYLEAADLSLPHGDSHSLGGTFVRDLWNALTAKEKESLIAPEFFQHSSLPQTGQAPILPADILRLVADFLTEWSDFFPLEAFAVDSRHPRYTSTLAKWKLVCRNWYRSLQSAPFVLCKVDSRTLVHRQLHILRYSGISASVVRVLVVSIDCPKMFIDDLVLLATLLHNVSSLQVSVDSTNPAACGSTDGEVSGMLKVLDRFLNRIPIAIPTLSSLAVSQETWICSEQLRDTRGISLVSLRNCIVNLPNLRSLVLYQIQAFSDQESLPDNTELPSLKRLYFRGCVSKPSAWDWFPHGKDLCEVTLMEMGGSSRHHRRILWEATQGSLLRLHLDHELSDLGLYKRGPPSSRSRNRALLNPPPLQSGDPPFAFPQLTEIGFDFSSLPLSRDVYSVAPRLQCLTAIFADHGDINAIHVLLLPILRPTFRLLRIGAGPGLHPLASYEADIATLEHALIRRCPQAHVHVESLDMY